MKPLDDPLTRESAEAVVVEAVRSVGGDDYEGWELVLETTLRHLRQHMQDGGKHER